ncbi:SMI1/KNR4 family protein [Pseudomonas benzenivorans]|uniref:SMI1/KNR4 family protein n=1 Tax=Pseudomonas benzenivorans TaxID=556533 RepID=A0ABY5H1J6_9PSED|nr:SMI1/KNR4 family protein [Pseudomonas benzenivorans]UTW05864.1 SMI1/KNR4 family protein [Pseudomonas benzenivorans]
MEEVIDQLRELNEPVPVPLELPDEETLVEIQEQILIHLPFALREFLLTVSDVVYGRLEPVTAADPQSHTYLPEVASVAWSLGVPREYVPLCEDQGNYYVVEEDGTVLLWEADTEEINEDESWESVWHWVRDVWLES